MRIIYFHQYFSTPLGSNGTRSFEFAKKLVEEGHEVTVVCLNTDRSFTGIKKHINQTKEEIINGIKIIEFNIIYSNNMSIFKRALKFSAYVIKSIKFAYKKDFDLVFCSSTPLTAAIPGIFLKYIKGIPFIFEVRDLWPELPEAMGVIKNKFILKALKILEVTSYKSADHIIGLAPGICKSIELNNILKSKITFIPNGCDLDLFKPFFEEKNINEIKDIFNAVFCGAHGQANGLESVLEVAEILKKEKRRDIKFTFIGDGKIKKKIVKKAKEKNLDNCFFLDPMTKYELASYIRKEASIGLMILRNITAFYDGTSPNKFFDYISTGLPVITNYPGWIAEIIRKNKIGISVQPNNAVEFARSLINLANDKKLQLKMGISSRKLAVKYFSRKDLNNKFYDVILKTYKRYENRKNNHFKKCFYIFFKSLCDKIFSLFLLIISSPLLIIIGILVKLNLGDPILFKQKRPGLNDKPFNIYKFRTMNQDLKIKDILIDDDEKRLTKFGIWLRSTSIDELPSLLNIIKGDMSFIGPRPLLMDYLNEYSEAQIKRQNIKPGLSGWAQINGRNNLSWEEKFKLDVWYVENINIFLDIKILIITIFKVLKRSNISPKDNKLMPYFKGNNKSK